MKDSRIRGHVQSLLKRKAGAQRRQVPGQDNARGQQMQNRMRGQQVQPSQPYSPPAEMPANAWQAQIRNRSTEQGGQQRPAQPGPDRMPWGSRRQRMANQYRQQPVSPPPNTGGGEVGGPGFWAPQPVDVPGSWGPGGPPPTNGSAPPQYHEQGTPPPRGGSGRPPPMRRGPVTPMPMPGGRPMPVKGGGQGYPVQPTQTLLGRDNAATDWKFNSMRGR